MKFVPFVLDAEYSPVAVTIEPLSSADAALTNQAPRWQTSWTSEYLAAGRFEKYAAKHGDELVALGAYEVLKNSLVVHIAYMEAQPESNPVIAGSNPKYTGIGRMLIAFGIKLSIDHGFAGDVVLEAKTSQLAKHYEQDFGAVPLPAFGSAPRYLIADESAKKIFFSYLK
ncbi:hypothetical protein AALA80_15650 [Oscillospiraceae bacterium 50-60]